MGRYVVGRVAQFSIVVVGAIVVVFVAMNLVSDPAAVMLPIGTPEDVAQQFRESHGLDGPIVERLWYFITHAVRGDFGDSIWLGSDALALAVDRLPATLLLTVPPVLIGATLGVAAGTLSARRPDSKPAQVLTALSYAAISIAEFWLAIMLVLLFAVQFQLLPTSGYDPKPQVLILPWCVLALRPFAHHFQLAQSTLSAEYGKLYVLALRARGLSEHAIARRHVMKNVAVPTLTLTFYELSRVFVGSAVVVEVVFSWPGVGRLAVGALDRGDLYLVAAVVFVSAVTTAGLNLCADLLYYVVDPRTRHLIGRTGS